MTPVVSHISHTDIAVALAILIVWGLGLWVGKHISSR